MRPSADPALSSFILEVTLPAGEGGRPVTVGGQRTLALTPGEALPFRPAFGLEVRTGPPDPAPALAEPGGGAAPDPVSRARRAAGELGADFLFLTLDGCHPDGGGRTVEEGCAVVRELLLAVPCPFIISGSGDEETDRRLLPAAAEASPRPAFLHYADEKNYRLVAGAALAYGHGVVSWSPIDINMAKQVNLLLADLSFPPGRILMDPLTGGLGYGLEYTYTIVERIRLSGLGGDAMLNRPVLCHLGPAWKAREAVEEAVPDWGDASRRGKRWEEATGWACLAAGADLLVCRHPENLAAFRDFPWR